MPAWLEWTILAWGLAAAAIPGLLVVGSAVAVLVLRPRRAAVQGGEPPRVALVRPFRGLEADAVRKNVSLLQQRYPHLEVIFACEDEDDPGVPAARAACATAPERARLVFSHGVPPVLSGKVRNMIAAWQATDAPLVGFCDSDILLDPDDLAALADVLADPEVGGACMFIVFDEPGLLGASWRLLSVADGFPLMSAAQLVGGRVNMQGGIMVFRRSALEASGGIAQLGDTFADDVRAGNLLQKHGFRVARAPRLLRHATPRESMTRTLQRLQRWSVCFRSEAPLGFFVQLLLSPIAIPALAAALLAGTSLAGSALAVLASGIGLRLAGSAFVDVALLRPRGVRLGWEVALRPLADALQFALSVVALAWPIVVWRGRSYRVGWHGRITQRLS